MPALDVKPSLTVPPRGRPHDRGMQDVAKLRCPWCGERFETLVDASVGDADYVEDCPVCCRPIEMHLAVDDDGIRLDAGRED